VETLAIIGAVIVAAIVIVLVYAATRPDTFRIARTTTINAPPEKIFAFISDFRKWPAWSPYEKMDPAMTRVMSGPATGVGSVYEWNGNKKVGQGRMEVIQMAPPSKITIKLDFFKPFEAHNTAEFVVEPKGGATAVTWAMHGPSPFMIKVMGIFCDMDKMVGKDFETGLANLRAAAES
jgi:K+-transporting ATPase KdpF subunit